MLSYPVLTLVLGYVRTFVTEAAWGSRTRRIAMEGREDALSVTHIAERCAFRAADLDGPQGGTCRPGRTAGKARLFDVMKPAKWV